MSETNNTQSSEGCSPSPVTPSERMNRKAQLQEVANTKSLTDEEIREVVDNFMGVQKVNRSTITSDFLMYEKNCPQIQVRRIRPSCSRSERSNCFN